MKNIAVLLPGIIRNYSHLEFISKMREFGVANNFNFYFYGYCYNFVGNGSHHWHFQREYNARKDLDINLIKSYSLTKLKITDQIIEKDKDGYDGRIISQWEGVKQSYLLYEETLFDFARQGFNLYMMDHRGQGLSERLTPDSHVGHVNDFYNYTLDLNIFIENS